MHKLNLLKKYRIITKKSYLKMFVINRKSLFEMLSDIVFFLYIKIEEVLHLVYTFTKTYYALLYNLYKPLTRVMERNNSTP